MLWHPIPKFTNVQYFKTSLCDNHVLPLLCMCELNLIDTFKEKGIPNTQESKTERGQKFRASMSYIMRRKNKERRGKGEKCSFL